MIMTGRFYYSDKATNARPLMGEKRTVKKCLLEDGIVMQYTEWVTKGRQPLSKWDDLVYLGNGIVLSIDGIRQATDDEVIQWKRRVDRRRRVARIIAVFFGGDK